MLMIVRYNKYDYINILTLKLNLIPIKDHTSNFTLFFSRYLFTESCIGTGLTV